MALEQNVDEQLDQPVEGQTNQPVNPAPQEVEAKLIENPEAKPQVEPEQEADGVGVIDAFADSPDDKKPAKVEPEVTAEAPALSSSPDEKPEVEQKPEQQNEEDREVGRYDDFGMTDEQKSSLVRHVKGEFSQRDQLAGKLAEIEQKQKQENKQEVTVDDRLEFLKEVNGRFELRDDISEKLAKATGKDRDTLERSLYLLDRQIKGDCRVLVERGFEKQLADDPEMKAKVEGSYQSDLSGHPGWRQSDLHVEVRKSSVPLTYYTQPAFSDPYVQKILARESEFRAEQQFLDGGPSELPAEYRQRMSAIEPSQKVEQQVEGQKVVENPDQKVEAKPEQQGEPKAEARAEGQQQDGVKPDQKPGAEVEQTDGQKVGPKDGPDAKVKAEPKVGAEVEVKAEGQSADRKDGAETGQKAEQKEAGEGREAESSARVAATEVEKVEAKAAKEAPTPRVAVDPGSQRQAQQDGQVSAAKPTPTISANPAEKLEIHRYAEAVQFGRELHGERAAGRGKTERSQAIAGALVDADQRWSEEGANGWDARLYNGAEGKGLRA